MQKGLFIWMLASLMCLLAFFVFLFVYKNHAHPKPYSEMVSFNGETYSFGVIRDFTSTVSAHDFAVRNLTDRPIAINSIKTSCGCLVARGPSLIPPHGEEVIKARMTVSNVVGTRTQYIAVIFEDRSTKILTLKAQIADEMLTFPPVLRFQSNHNFDYEFSVIRKTVPQAPPQADELSLSSDDPNVKIVIVSSREKHTARDTVVIDDIKLTFDHRPNLPSTYLAVAKYGDGIQWPFPFRIE